MDLFTSLVVKPEVEIYINELEGRKRSLFKNKSGEIELPTFRDKEDVSGKVIINIKSTKRYEHKGIKIELVGSLESLDDNKGSNTKFITLAKDLEPPSVLLQESTTFEFKFTNVEKLYESYYGTSMQVR